MPDLIFAFPSKGRIHEQAHEFFGRDFLGQNHGRSLQIKLPAIPDMVVVLLPAVEIAHQLRHGDVHIGLTGEDLICEISDHWKNYVDQLARFAFAQARLITAVPQSWIDVNNMEDLDDAAINFRRRHHRRMRFATKYPHLTRAFFSRHGLIDYRLIESLGATEAAPINHVAEAITDLVSTGATLKNNDLKPLADGVIIKSQAALFASRRAFWDEPLRQTARALLEKMQLEPALIK